MHVLHMRLPFLVEQRLAVVARHLIVTVGGRGRRAHGLAEIEDAEALRGRDHGPGRLGADVVAPDVLVGIAGKRLAAGPFGDHDLRWVGVFAGGFKLRGGGVGMGGLGLCV